MSEYIHKSHNVTVLMYHLVFPAKYRRAVIDGEVDEVLKETCIEIEKRYQVKFLEIGTDRDHVHFLVQSVPMYSVTKLVRMIKSITAREAFRLLARQGRQDCRQLGHGRLPVRAQTTRCRRLRWPGLGSLRRRSQELAASVEHSTALTSNVRARAVRPRNRFPNNKRRLAISRGTAG